MNLYDNILSFKGTWRRYQERVLNSSDAYLSDKKIHIVAAPGAGKTTLGIELIRRTKALSYPFTENCYSGAVVGKNKRRLLK